MIRSQSAVLFAAFFCASACGNHSDVEIKLPATTIVVVLEAGTAPQTETGVDASEPKDAASEATSDVALDSATPPASPTLEFTYDGPTEHEEYMGEDARMFCFSLHATGASFDVSLPASLIHGVGDANVRTDSLMGTVFGLGSVFEGTTFVVNTGKISLAPNAIEYNNLPGAPFSVGEGMTRHLCIDISVTNWSHTPSDFYGKSFQFEMGDWADGNVVFSDTKLPLPRAQIISPIGKIDGPAVRILSKDGSTHPERYTGTLHIRLDAATPGGLNIFPGNPNVQMTTLDFRADGTGSCLRNFYSTDFGTGPFSDLEYIWLYTNPKPGETGTAVAGGEKPSTSWFDLGYADGGFLFCLEGGESVSYTVAAQIADSAIPGGTHAFGIWDLLTDVWVVQGNVEGYSPTRGNTFTLIKP